MLLEKVPDILDGADPHGHGSTLRHFHEFVLDQEFPDVAYPHVAIGQLPELTFFQSASTGSSG